MSIISNTTVLSNFAAINQLDLLQKLYARLYMPTAVYEEIRRGLDEGYIFYRPLMDRIYPFQDNGWIYLTHVAGDTELRRLGKLPPRIHAGEAECLVIARERDWLLLTDDRAARKIARAWSVPLSGTLGTLLLLVEKDICPLPEANDYLSQMIGQGYRSYVTDLNVLLGK
jgi:uncharacterized protein